MALLVIHPRDNVGTALDDMQAGDQTEGIELREPVSFGFKVALRAIDSGEQIIKYGESIGVATCRIEPGEMVHVHNIQSLRAGGNA
jgi:altronate dehydratase